MVWKSKPKRVSIPSPLVKHGGRAADHDFGDLAQQELAGNQPGLDRLAKPHAIGDEQIHPRHGKRHPQRFELIMLDTDPARNGA